MEEIKIDLEVIASGYGFLSNTKDGKVKVLSISMSNIYEQVWDDNLQAKDVFIFWTYEIDKLINFIKASLLDRESLINVISSYEPCPLSLVKNKLTGDLTLHIGDYE